jgi:hypothetical protein
MRRIGIVAVLAAAFGTTGCGGPPELVPVTGTVKLDGKPVGGVRVHFWPTDASSKTFVYQLALGITDTQGKFELHSSHGLGIAAGNYKVTFSRPLAAGGKTVNDPNRKPEEAGARESLPPHYTDQDKTQETATVSKESNDFVFNLKSK